MRTNVKTWSEEHETLATEVIGKLKRKVLFWKSLCLMLALVWLVTLGVIAYEIAVDAVWRF